MAKFELAVALTLKNEGGYVDNKSDTGGATNMGVTQKDVPNIPIKNLTVEQAIAFYRAGYWKTLYGEIESQDVANKLFDLGVLFGIGQAVKGIQDVLGLKADGGFGPETLLKVNDSEPVSLLNSYKFHMVQLAAAIGAAHPAERQFVGGWLRRINS